MKNNKLFFVGQKALIKKDNEVLVLFEQDGKLDFPGGRIQEREVDFDESLRREIEEETSIKVVVKNPFYRWGLEFERNGEMVRIFLLAFGCEYVSGEVKLSKEHVRYLWVDKNSYKELNDVSDYFKVLEKYFNSI